MRMPPSLTHVTPRKNEHVLRGWRISFTVSEGPPLLRVPHERQAASFAAVVVPFEHQMPLKEGQNFCVKATVLGPDSISP
jgi:hypothetical protein